MEEREDACKEFIKGRLHNLCVRAEQDGFLGEEKGTQEIFFQGEWREKVLAGEEKRKLPILRGLVNDKLKRIRGKK